MAKVNIKEFITLIKEDGKAIQFPSMKEQICSENWVNSKVIEALPLNLTQIERAEPIDLDGPADLKEHLFLRGMFFNLYGKLTGPAYTYRVCSTLLYDLLPRKWQEKLLSTLLSALGNTSDVCLEIA